MSITGILEAMRSRRPLAERLVWQCLENHANGARLWPISEEAIAQELGLGVATVSRAVRALAADNILRAERHKRRPTVFHMLRDYPKPNGQTPPPSQNLTHQVDASTTHLTNQIEGSTAAPKPELTHQVDASTIELTHQGDMSSAELTHQNDRPFLSTSKNPPVSKNPPRSRAHARTPRHLLPDDWGPSQKSVALGSDLGLTHSEVLFEADKMRDWARHEGKNGKDWEGRFNNWLRKEAKDRYLQRIRNQKPTLAEEWGLKSFLTPVFDDDEPPAAGRLLS